MKVLPTLFTGCLIAFSLSSFPRDAQASVLLTDVSQKAKPATIRVLLAKQTEKALIEAKGRYQVYNILDGLQLKSGVLGRRAYIYAQEEGLNWGESFPGNFQLRIVPGDSQCTILVNGIQYKGCVEIYSTQGKLMVVNEIDIENYLRSTLGMQFTEELDEEVLDSVAIVARTHSYYLAKRNPSALWDVDAAEVGYQGYGLVLQNLHIDRAIENTRHMVLTYKSTPFAATWTKDSAGKTAPFSSIFRKDISAPTGVEAPFAAKDRQKHHWSFSVHKQEFADIVQMGQVNAVDLYLDKDSNKVYAVRISDGEHSKDIDFFKLQKALGASRLLSNDFTVNLKGDSVIFSGFGEGHGVGLCLYSAQMMAEKGEKAPKILSTFFPNSKLENIRSFVEPANTAMHQK